MSAQVRITARYANASKAVFDIDGNNVLLAQYANCGKSPRSAQSSEFANMSGQCGQQDLAPNTRVELMNEENGAEECKGAIEGQSAAPDRLAANTKGLATAVGVAFALALGL